MNTHHPLVGRRVLHRHRQSCYSTPAFRDAHKGVVVGIWEGCNPSVVVKFDGREFNSTLPPQDLAFCETWPDSGSTVEEAL